MDEIMELEKDILIRKKARKNKTLVNILIIGLLVFSFFYFASFILASADTSFSQIISKYMYGFANLLNFNKGDMSSYIYLTASIKLFLMIFPVSLLYCHIDKNEEKEIQKYYDRKRIKEYQIKKQKEKFEKIKKLNSIESYSICLSFDYSKNNLKDKFNKVIFQKLKNILSNYEKNIDIIQSKVLILYSSDYKKYDEIYSKLLKSIATIKDIFQKKYDILITPTITVDSSKNQNDYEIMKNHFDIQDFNFKNKAISTNKFSENYSNLGYNKYIQTPIGEFINDKSSFELNSIYEDLNKAMDNYNLRHKTII